MKIEPGQRWCYRGGKPWTVLRRRPVDPTWVRSVRESSGGWVCIVDGESIESTVWDRFIEAGDYTFVGWSPGTGPTAGRGAA